VQDIKHYRNIETGEVIRATVEWDEDTRTVSVQWSDEEGSAEVLAPEYHCDEDHAWYVADWLMSDEFDAIY
jgi:hypothetical protein